MNAPPVGTEPRQSRDEALVAYLEALESGDAPTVQRLREQDPDLAREAEEFLAREVQLDRLFAPLRPAVCSSEPVLPVGTQVNSYQILEHLDRGGMGVVYRALQQGPNREVALKMLRGGEGSSAEDMHRLRTEAEHAARLDHPNIVPIYEVGDHQGQPYFSMMLVRGGSLARLPVGLADDPCRVARLLLAVARAVHYAHQRGLLHRDLKPANILLSGKTFPSDAGNSVRLESLTYVPMVTDFGLAQHIGAVSEGKAGTPSYMAPEQAAGEAMLTVAVDVYGLGAILYELLTGRSPFRGSTREETLTLIRTQPLTPPRVCWPRTPPDLEAICLKCLEKDPVRRYSSAEELALDLERFLHRQPVKARPRSAPARLGLWVRRQPLLAALLAALGILTGLGASLWWERDRSDRLNELRQWAQYATSILMAERYLEAGQLKSANDALDLCLTLGPRRLGQWEYHYLRRANRRDVILLPHPAQVLRVQYSPDGSALLTAGDDGRIRLWDPLTGQRRYEWPIRINGSVSACFCQDSEGTGLVTVAEDQPIRQWDLGTGRLRRTFPQRGTRVAAALRAPVIACLDREQTLTAWRLEGSPAGPSEQRQWLQQALGTLAAPAPAAAISLLPQAPVAVRTALQPVPVLVVRLPPGLGQAIDLALSADGRYLAVGGFDRLLQVWDLAIGRELRPFVLPSWADWTNIWAVAFSPDGKHLAASGPRPVIWDLASGDVVGQLDGTNDMTCSTLTYSADGTRLAGTYRDGQVRVWNTATGKTMPAPLKDRQQTISADFSPDGRQLAWARGREVAIEQLQRPRGSFGQVWSRKEAADVPRPPFHRALWALSFSPDGRLLAVRSATEVILWDRATGQPIREWPLQDILASEVPLAFSPDGRLLLTGGRGDSLQAWDTESGQPVAGLPVRNTRFLAFAPRAAGGTLATTDGGKRVVLWRTDGSRLATLEDAGVGEVYGLAFAPDGRRLAVCGSRGPIRIWTITGSGCRLTQSCYGHSHPAWCLAFSPDGRRLASGSADETVRLWDATSGQELFTLSGHNGLIARLAFSPDGQRLASCSSDGLVKVWDLQTGYSMLTLTGHTGYVTGVAFSPDGRCLASCSQDGTVRIWDGTPVSE